jgi:hypothetical protein
LHITSRAPGRAVCLLADGACYAGRGYSILRSADDAQTWAPVAQLPCTMGRRLASVSRLASRLLRHEVRALAVLPGGSLVAASREGIFYGMPGERRMRPSTVEAAGQTLAPPMTLTTGPGGRVVCGEYDSRTAHGRPVRVLVSDDGGRSFQIARVFEGGSILHVHNLVYDPSLRKYWLLAGDHGHEPGIGLLGEDFRDFDWLVKGEQRFRAVEVFDFGDRLIYGTDSEREANAIVSLDKRSGRLERLSDLEGSCIYACRFGGVYALSTTVEPSAVNPSRWAALWVSRDGSRWERVLQAEKDRWHARYFQYGSLVLPRGASERETIFFSGQALRGLDGMVYAARLERR